MIRAHFREVKFFPPYLVFGPISAQVRILYKRRICVPIFKGFYEATSNNPIGAQRFRELRPITSHTTEQINLQRTQLCTIKNLANFVVSKEHIHRSLLNQKLLFNTLLLVTLNAPFKKSSLHQLYEIFFLYRNFLNSKAYERNVRPNNSISGEHLKNTSNLRGSNENDE